MKNIVTNFDSKMNYTDDEPTSKSITQSSIHINKATSSNIPTSEKLSKENVELALKRKDVAEKNFNENFQTKRLKHLVIDNNKEEVDLSLKRKDVAEKDSNENVQTGEVNHFKNKNNVTSIGKIKFRSAEDHINQIFQTIDIQTEYISSDEENIDTYKISVSSTKNEKIIYTNESTYLFKHNTEKNYSTKISDGTKTNILENMYDLNKKGETYLHQACNQESLNLVHKLLSKGFNPNVKNSAGWTPLHEAVKVGRLDIVKMLIHNGACINTPGFRYETPLFTAVKYNHFDIAKTLLQYGADKKCMNIFGERLEHVNLDLMSQLMKCKIPITPLQIKKTEFKPNEIVIFLDNIILNNAFISIFCKQFNAKVVKNILNKKELEQVTHIIVPKTEDNICGETFKILLGMANGIFIMNQNWILDSLKVGTLRPCEYYEVNGTASFPDSNGPQLSRKNRLKMGPKLFSNINIYLLGNVGWKQYTLGQLKTLILEFGAKLVKRIPEPEDFSFTIYPYHCHSSELMCYVSNIILFTKDSNRLMKYNTKQIRVYHISWFIEAIQKHCIV